MVGSPSCVVDSNCWSSNPLDAAATVADAACEPNHFFGSLLRATVWNLPSSTEAMAPTGIFCWSITRWMTSGLNATPMFSRWGETPGWAAMTVTTGSPVVWLLSRSVTTGSPETSGGSGSQPRGGSGSPKGRRVLRIWRVASTTSTVLTVPSVARRAFS